MNDDHKHSDSFSIRMWFRGLWKALVFNTHIYSLANNIAQRKCQFWRSLKTSRLKLSCNNKAFHNQQKKTCNLKIFKVFPFGLMNDDHKHSDSFSIRMWFRGLWKALVFNTHIYSLANSIAQRKCQFWRSLKTSHLKLSCNNKAFHNQQKKKFNLKVFKVFPFGLMNDHHKHLDSFSIRMWFGGLWKAFLLNNTYILTCK
jgi:hypothetical protein